MKGLSNKESMQSKQGNTNKPITEIRDNIDSLHNKKNSRNNSNISKKQGNSGPKKLVGNRFRIFF